MILLLLRHVFISTVGLGGGIFLACLQPILPAMSDVSKKISPPKWLRFQENHEMGTQNRSIAPVGGQRPTRNFWRMCELPTIYALGLVQVTGPLVVVTVGRWWPPKSMIPAP
jgi:hypothetical protein